MYSTATPVRYLTTSLPPLTEHFTHFISFVLSAVLEVALHFTNEEMSLGDVK